MLRDTIDRGAGLPEVQATLAQLRGFDSRSKIFFRAKYLKINKSR